MATKMLILACAAVAATVAACEPNVHIVPLDEIPPAELKQAYAIEVYTLDRAGRPDIEAVLGPVDGFSCQFLNTDPPASKGAALTQLRLMALRKGANAVIDVSFDTRGTQAWGTGCWESVQASGIAVRVKKP